MDDEKKYKEALEKLQKALTPTEDGRKISGLTRCCIENIFPELKEVESNDERIRRVIRGWIYTRPASFFDNNGITKEEILTWLEKQGEKNTAKPKFHEGDWIAHNVANFVFQIVGVGTYGYNVVNREGYAKTISLSNEENYHLWTIQDAKDGDVLVCNINKAEIGGDIEKLPNITPIICVYQNVVKDKDYIHTYCSLYNGSSLILSNSMYYNTFVYNIQPATKEQRDQLEKAMADAGYTFDFDKKELKKVEQKSTDKDEPKEDNRPVTERIKTFNDACNALDDEHPLVTQYRLTAAAYKGDPMTEDFIAYLKLRIIVAALNEGWEPKFTEDEYRYFPWFYFYNKEQYDELDIEEKERCVLRSGVYMSSYYGFMYVVANDDASVSNTSNGSRLVFRTRELAAYAGRQFTEEWADFVFKTE